MSIIEALSAHIGESVNIQASGSQSFSGKLVAVHPDGIVVERIQHERQEHGPERTHQQVTAAFIPLAGLAQLTLSFARVVEG